MARRKPAPARPGQSRADGFLFAGWMSLASPQSIVTAIAVFVVRCRRAIVASRISGTLRLCGAICTKRNGNLPAPRLPPVGDHGGKKRLILAFAAHVGLAFDTR